MKFNLNDFLQLDANGLLAVNGGTSCSSGSSSSPSSNGPSSPSGPSTPTGGGSSGGCSSGGGNCGGGKSDPKQPSTPQKPTLHGGPDGAPAFDDSGKPISYEEHYHEPSSSGGSCGGKDTGDDNPQTEKSKNDPTRDYVEIVNPKNKEDGAKPIHVKVDTDGNVEIEYSDGTKEKGSLPKGVNPPKTIISTNYPLGGGNPNNPSEPEQIGNGTGENDLSTDGTTTVTTTGTFGVDSHDRTSTPTNPGTTTDPEKTKTPSAPKLSAYDKLLNAIIAKGNGENITKGDDPGEIKYAYTDNYQCDNYVEEIVRSAGYKASDYSIDDPNGKDVDTHIADLIASGKSYQTDASKLTSGVYVVFMSDDDKKERSHSGLLFVDENGGSFIYDNSSHNFDTGIKDNQGKKMYDNGIEKYGGKNFSASDVIHAYQWCYESFYFQKIN